MKKTTQTKKIIKKIKKLSSLDILGLFLIFFITASLYLLLGRKTEYLEITIRLFNHDAPEYSLDSNQPKAWYIEQIKPGKIQKSGLGETLVEITDVYSYPNGYIYNDVYVTLKVKAIQNKITKQYIYEGSPLLIHDVRTFRIQDLLINGEIIDIGKKKHPTKKLSVTFELEPKGLGSDLENNSQAMIKGVENYIADKIKTGMVINDSHHNEIVKIINVNKKSGGEILFSPIGKQFVIDPNRTQVTITTELIAEKINNHFYYRKEEPLIIDDHIYLTFDKITVNAKIVDIQEYEEE